MIRDVLIVADIEGSSGCFSYDASAFMAAPWPRACLEMSRDVNTVATALLDAGVETVRVKDFHRTGYNLIPAEIDPRVRLIQGYAKGPVPGIGDPGSGGAAFFLGMHAASGTNGFLAHTLTSRFSKITVNGRVLPEILLFSASLAASGVRPAFFSGCPVACRQAEQAVPGIRVHPIDKSAVHDSAHADAWRRELAAAAVNAAGASPAAPPFRGGPLNATVAFRDGPRVARKLATRWGLPEKGGRVQIAAADMDALYSTLIRLAYLSPLAVKLVSIGLRLSNWRGRWGLDWACRRLRNHRRRRVRQQLGSI